MKKSDEQDLSKLRSLFSTAIALVHPTSADIQPLVISEAGYFGCPAITARSFGIPELVDDGVTGYLVDTPLTVEAFARQMLNLCERGPGYFAMREAVRQKTTSTLTWQSVGNRIAQTIQNDLVAPHLLEFPLAISV